jgi:hypothetical protein
MAVGTFRKSRTLQQGEGNLEIMTFPRWYRQKIIFDHIFERGRLIRKNILPLDRNFFEMAA